MLQAFVAARTELTPDEAYYRLWSEHLSWGYLDHPPMVALWIRASRALFGDSALGVRALGILAGLAGALASARTAWVLFGGLRTAALAALLFAAPPLLDIGAPIATPDIPLTVFWTLGLLALAELSAGAGLWAWALLGLCLGAACLSKFTGAFFGAGVFLALLAVPRLRPWLKRPEPYAAALLALAILAPFLAWNAAHGWMTFAKQFARVPVESFAPGYFFEFLGAQAGLLNPLVAALAVAALANVRRDGGRTLLAATIAPALAYFAFHALHARVQGNWLAPLYPALVVLAAAAAADAARGWRLWAARIAPPLGLAVTALAAAQAIYAPVTLDRRDPTARLAGWRELAAEVAALAQSQRAGFVTAQGYALTSELKTAGPAPLPVEQIDERQRWLFEPQAPQGEFAAPGLAIGSGDADFESRLRLRFSSVTPLGELARRRGGAAVEFYKTYRVEGLIRAPSGEAWP